MRLLPALIVAILAILPSRAQAQEISEGVTLGVERGVELYWTVSTAPDDSWESLAKRFLRGPGDSPALIAANRGGTLPGAIVKIPYSLLRYDEQRLTLLTLFPLDRNDGEDWLHVVGQAEKIPGESLSGVSLWFTGRRELYRDIAADNRITYPGLAPGQQLRIRQSLLLPAFLTPDALEAAMREAALHPPPPPPLPPVSAPASPPSSSSSPSPLSSPSPISGAASASSAASAPNPVPAPPPALIKPDEIDLPPPVTPALRFGRDSRGEYAIYELRPHEALYSSVVIRFMGLVDAPEVNKQALLLAKQNGIADVTQIPAGFGIKIRAENLLPQYSPPGSAARIKYENRQRELLQASSDVAAPGPVPLLRSNRLKGVTVILDAGHGGPDPGTMHNGLWESDFVYDIFVRVKERLEKTTAAAVLAIVRDPVADFTPRDEISARTEKLEILTTPPFTPKKGDSRAAVNQRAKLITRLARSAQAAAAGAPVVFTSFHADALHPSARGTMIYVPDAELSMPARLRSAKPRKGKKGKVEKTAEPAPDVMSRSERIKAEAFSGRLASTLVRILRGEKIEVHPYDPVRSYVVRGGRPWVPAVIRDTPLRFKLLVEVCNLANAEDAKNLRDPKFRQNVAEAYVTALEKQFAPAKEKKR